MDSAWAAFLQLGAPGVVLLVLWLIVKTGDLRTRFEASVWESRSNRAEQQADTLLVSMTKHTQALDELADTVRALKDQNAELIRMLPPRASVGSSGAS